MTAKPRRTDSPAKQIAVFIARFDPAIAKLVRASRSALRKRWPAANELVYDNYNALAIGYSSTDRVRDVLVSLAVYARGVNLYFYYGKSLPDPKGLLRGNGNQGRFIPLDHVALLAKPDVRALLTAAATRALVPLPVTGRGRTLIKSVSAKQRPRRPGAT